MKPRANKQAAATIKDVARIAGVSAMTVSRVLNGETNVRPATRERVMDAIKELDYRPNISARSLAKARSFFIGLLYDNPNPGYVSELLVGTLKRCRKAGYHLVIESCGPREADWERDLDAILRSSNFDGVIIPPPVCDYPGVLEAVRAAGIPCVRLAPETEFDTGGFVRTDDRDAAYRITRHLIDLGHCEIGFIKGHPEHGSTQKRLQGFIQAMQEAGLDVPENGIADGEYTYKSGLDAATRLLERNQRPTAIFASNDDMAAGVIAASHKFGLELPRDLSVVGFDDTQTASTVWPPLTTVRQPIAEMAAAAVDVLTTMLEAADDERAGGHAVDIPCEIILRESATGPSC